MSKAPQPKVTKTSVCNCGGVEISVTGVDKGAVLCHCSNCKASAGSAFAHNHRFTKAELQFLKGEDLIREYADSKTKTGNTVLRHFCGTCGCPMYLTNKAVPNFYALHGGSIQGSKQPSFELFPEEKLPWLGDVTGKAKL